MDPHIFLAVLVNGKVDGAEGASTNLLLDEILVDAVLGGAVIFGIAIFGARIEGFLGRSAPCLGLDGTECGWHLDSAR